MFQRLRRRFDVTGKTGSGKFIIVLIRIERDGEVSDSSKDAEGTPYLKTYMPI